MFKRFFFSLNYSGIKGPTLGTNNMSKIHLTRSITVENCQKCKKWSPLPYPHAGTPKITTCLIFKLKILKIADF